MLISKTQHYVTEMVLARKNVFMWSAPGIGKTTTVRNVAKHIRATRIPNYGLIVCDLSMMDAVDFNGTPKVEDDTTRWYPPAFWDELNERFVELHKEPDWQGMIFFDEFSQAYQMTQNAAGTMVMDRRIGQYPLPKGVSFVGASNKKEHKAGTHEMGTQVKTRWNHINVEASTDCFRALATKLNLVPEVLAFVEGRAELLVAFDPKADTFPTLRTWHNVSDIMQLDLPQDDLEEGITGYLGEVASREFIGFLRTIDSLPTPSEIRNDPQGAMVPTDPSALYAVTGLIANAIREDTVDVFGVYVERLPREYQSVTVEMIEAINASILESEWGVKMRNEFGNQK